MRAIVNAVILILIGVVLFFSCESDEKNSTQSDNTYQLRNILNDSNWIEMTDTFSVNIICIDYDIINNNDRYIIKSDIEYKNMYYSIKSNYQSCLNYQLPIIDFNKYTLLGYITKNYPHDIKQTIYKNEYEKKYVYVVNVTITSFNKILITKTNWLLVPKIPSDYSVEVLYTLNYRIDD